jgi:glycosyltransferase involved in cell wall biosynthesis
VKLLIVINTLNTGGAEKLVLETLPKFKQKGIDVDLLVLWDNDSIFMRKLRDLNCCKIIVLKKSNKLRDLYSLSNIWLLRKHLNSYDIAHVHLFPSFYFAVVAKALSFGKCKLVYTEHTTTNTRMERWYFKPLDSLIYSCYTKIIAISSKMNEVLTEYIPSLSVKLVNINNGVDITAIDNAKPLQKKEVLPSTSEKSKLVLQVSAFREQKDQATLIRSMLLLPEEVLLWLAGDGQTREQNELLVRELKLSHRVFFLGNRTDIPQLLKTADIVVLSSYYEGLSLASIEGMASGKPFVASDVPGLSEIVKDAGVLFPQGDDKQLAYEIKRLLEDEEYSKKTIRNCEVRASSYDINKMVSEHIHLYKKMFDEK